MYKILQHTADLAVNFSGDNLKEFLNSIVLFFKNEVITQCVNPYDSLLIKKDYYEENISYSIITLLNDIIFYLEQNFLIENIEVLNYNEKSFFLLLTFKKCEILELGIELKAATYHNLHLIENVNYLNMNIIFDI